MNFRAGAAVERITPDEPLWLAGYLVRKEPAKGTIFPPRATWISWRGVRFRVVVGADMCWRRLVEERE